MKTLFLILTTISIGCRPASSKNLYLHIDTIKPGTQIVHDSVPVFKLVVDNRKIDSLNKIVDSLKSSLFLSNYRLSRVRYYLKIAIKNPKQDKFLKSWINRAVN